MRHVTSASCCKEMLELLILTGLKLHLCVFIYSLISFTSGRGKKIEYPEKTYDNELEKLPHVKA